MTEQNPFLGKSQAERDRQRALLDQADAAEGAIQDVVAAAAIKWGIRRLKGVKEGDSKLGAILEGVAPTALPKEANLAKPGGLSETEVNNLKAAVDKALSNIKV